MPPGGGAEQVPGLALLNYGRIVDELRVSVRTYNLLGGTGKRGCKPEECPYW